MSKLARLLLATFIYIFPGLLGAAPIEFEVKTQTLGDNQEPLTFLGNFTTGTILGSEAPDIVAPKTLRTEELDAPFLGPIVNLQNEEFWQNPQEPYFSPHYAGGRSFKRAIQTLFGQFDQNPLPDLVILNRESTGQVGICFNSTSCGEQNTVILEEAGVDLFPVAAAVADFNGDGFDDLAVAGFSYPNNMEMYEGYVMFYQGTGMGKPVPQNPEPITDAIPYAVVIGNFDLEDNPNPSPDLMVASMHKSNGSCDTQGATLTLFGFSEGNLQVQPVDPNLLKIEDCFRPTNLKVYNPGQVKGDSLVLACFDRQVIEPVPNNQNLCHSNLLGGQAIVLRHQQQSPTSLVVAQKIGNEGNVSDVSVNDFNEDDRSDLLIASHDGEKIISLEGQDGAFGFDLNTKKDHPIELSVAFVKTLADFDQDGKIDPAFTAQNIIWPNRMPIDQYIYEVLGHHGLGVLLRPSEDSGIPICGNGEPEEGEECDLGVNNDDQGACTTQCKNAVCGDGLVHNGIEECDQGANNNDQGSCTSQCKNAVCGDGLIWQGQEACDDNDPNAPATCSDCQISTCGDGEVNEGEECDDGNNDDQDACLNNCLNARCGDGKVQAGVEACDDGNLSNQDACLNACAVASCGDGYIQAGVEACDPKNNANCTSQCQLPVLPGDPPQDPPVIDEGQASISCPKDMPTQTVAIGQRYRVCVPEIVGTVVVGWTSNSEHLQDAQVNGRCFEGMMSQEQERFWQGQTYDLSYMLQSESGEVAISCPANLVKPGADLSGGGCQIQTVNSSSVLYAAWALCIIGFGVFAYGRSRVG